VGAADRLNFRLAWLQLVATIVRLNFCPDLAEIARVINACYCIRISAEIVALISRAYFCLASAEIVSTNKRRYLCRAAADITATIVCVNLCRGWLKLR
jgi:hypothetical protein